MAINSNQNKYGSNNPLNLSTLYSVHPELYKDDSSVGGFSIVPKEYRNPSNKQLNKVNKDEDLVLLENTIPSTPLLLEQSENNEPLSNEDFVNQLLESTPWGNKESRAFRDNIEKARQMTADIQREMFEAQLAMLNSDEYKEYVNKYNSFYKDMEKLFDIIDNLNNVTGKDAETIHTQNYDFFKDLAANVSIKDGSYSNLAEYYNDWNNAEEGDKLKEIVYAIGKEYLPEGFWESFSSDKNIYNRMGMLASYLRANPMYKTFVDKQKEEIGNIFDPITGKIKDTYNEGVNSFSSFLGPVGKIIRPIASSLGEAVIDLGSNITQYTTAKFSGEGKLEDVDAVLRKEADIWEDKISEGKYNEIMSSLEKLLEALSEFDRISKDTSNKYRANQGTYLTEELGTDEERELDREDKIKLYAKYIVKTDIYGEGSANLGITDYWSDYIANKQSTIDKILDTGATFGATAVADIISAGALLSNFYYMVDTSNVDLGNIATGLISNWGDAIDEINKIEFEGYSDALVKNNTWMDYANRLQETGEFDPSELKKWQDLGINKHLIYSTVEEENSWIKFNDVYDAVGQYGFTAASTALSLGGSAAAKGTINILTRAAMAQGKIGNAARFLRAPFNKELREIVKKGLASGATLQEKIAALRQIVEWKNNALYKGQLWVGGAIGTAEGGLEAESTYNSAFEDYSKGVNDNYNSRIEAINLASNEKLAEYLKAKGELPDLMSTNAEGTSTTQYSNELYLKAREELKASLIEGYNAGIVRAEDDATDAACANFLANSAINGITNTMFKIHFQSKDVGDALRFARGERRFEDLVEVALTEGNIVARTKVGKGLTAKNIWEATKKGAKNIWGETLEEYGQSVSDATAQAMFEKDMDNYINVMFDDNARNAYSTDISNIVRAGLEGFTESLTSKEALQSAYMGALSTAIGGVDPTSFLTSLRKKKKDESYLEYFKKMGINALNGAWKAAYEEQMNEIEEAERWADHINAWANKDSTKEMLTHLGGAMGFTELLNQSILNGDEFSARTSKLDAAIENILTLDIIKDTEAGKAYALKIQEMLELNDVAQKDENFDNEGNYIGLEKWIADIISSVKNSNKTYIEDLHTTEREIVTTMGNNAKEFLELQSKVKEAQRLVRLTFGHKKALDPVVESTYIHALLNSEDSKDRFDKLQSKLLKAFEDVVSSKSGLSKGAINTLIQHHSLGELKKKREEVAKKISEADAKKLDKTYKKTDKARYDRERNLAEQDAKAYRQLLKEINRVIAAYENELSDKQEKITFLSEGKEVESTISVTPIFTAEDMKEMSPALLDYVLNNRSKYSRRQQKEIENFLTYMRMARSIEESRPEMTIDDVILEFTDLHSLLNKSTAYQNHLTEFLNDPRILTARVASARNRARTDALKYKYRHDLSLRLGENAFDLLTRIDAKIAALEDAGKLEDADILKSIKNSIPEIKNLIKVQEDIEKLGLLALKKDASLALNPMLPLIIAALKTIAEAGDLDLDAIKKLLDENNIDRLRELLSATTFSGNRLLNNNLASYLQDLIFDKGNITKEQLDKLDSLISTGIKPFMDTFYKKGTPISTGAQVNPPTGSAAVGTSTPTPNPSSAEGNRNEGLSINMRDENPVLDIKTPGLLDLSITLLNEEIIENPLVEFLNDRGASEFLKHSQRDNSKVSFMVTTEYQSNTPVVFAVVPIKGNGTGKEFIINGLKYQVIGIVSLLQSLGLYTLGTIAYNKLLSNQSALINYNGGTLTSEVIHRTSATGSADGPKGQSLIEQFEEQASKNVSSERREGEKQGWILGRITLFIEDIFTKGKDTPYKIDEGPNGKRKAYLWGVPIDMEGNIHDFPITYNSLKYTVRTLLRDSTLTGEQKIEALKNSPFFEAYFEAWNKMSTNENAQTAYLKLIGNYIYLGYKDKGKDTGKNLDVKEENGYLVLQGYDKPTNEHIRFEIKLPSPIVGTPEVHKENELLALTALTDIINSKDDNDSDNDKFSYYKVQFPIDWIQIVRDKNYEEAKKLLKKLIRGLIEAGIIHYEWYDSFKRGWKVPNPLFNQSHRLQTTNSNINVNPSTQRPFVPQDPVKAKEIVEKLFNKELNEKQLKAENLLQAIIAESSNVELPDRNAEEYVSTTNTGESYVRVTSLKESRDDGNPPKQKRDWSENIKRISSAFGNVLDAIGRHTISILNGLFRGNINLEGITTDEVKDAFKGDVVAVDKLISAIREKLKKTEGLAVNGKIPSISPFREKVVDSIIKIYIQLYLTHPGWKFSSVDIKAFGRLKVMSGGQQVGTINTAGTLDIIAYDEEGVFHIIDMKTVHQKNGDLIDIDYRKEGWQNQVDGYQTLLQYRHSDMVFGDNYTVPVFLDYSFPAEEVVVKSANDGLSAMVGNKELTINGARPSSISLLHTLNPYLEVTISEDKLTKELKAKVKYSQDDDTDSPALGALHQGSGTDITNTDDTTPIDQRDGWEEFEEQQSRRTVRQAKYVEFINNHIKPLQEVSINVIAKLKSKIKELLSDKEAINNILKSDLANTFFNGNITKLELIIGNASITNANLSNILNSIKQYYSDLVNNSSNCSQILKRDYLQNSILYLAITELWSDEMLVELLQKNNINISKMPEIIYYLDAIDREEYSKELLKKLLQSEEYKEEHYNQKIKALNDTNEMNTAILEFLNSELAVELMSIRLNSVKLAILDGKYKHPLVNAKNTVEALLNNEEGSYNVNKILSEISTKTNIPAFNNLAQRLLQEIRRRHLSISLSINDEQLNLVEGTTNGRNINILKNSLDTYEHFERVFLHEMLHAVIDLSPDMKLLLEELYKECLSRYLRVNRMSVVDIKNSIYGFKNVDEFITEFFTNYSFLILLQDLPNEKYSNMKLSLLQSIKNIFTKRNNLYNVTASTLDSILMSINKKDTNRKTIIQEAKSYYKHSYDNQSSKVKEYIKLRGISKEEFNALPLVFQKQLLECCL